MGVRTCTVCKDEVDECNFAERVDHRNGRTYRREVCASCRSRSAKSAYAAIGQSAPGPLPTREERDAHRAEVMAAAGDPLPPIMKMCRCCEEVMPHTRVGAALLSSKLVASRHVCVGCYGTSAGSRCKYDHIPLEERRAARDASIRSVEARKRRKDAGLEWCSLGKHDAPRHHFRTRARKGRQLAPAGSCRSCISIHAASRKKGGVPAYLTGDALHAKNERLHISAGAKLKPSLPGLPDDLGPPPPKVKKPFKPTKLGLAPEGTRCDETRDWVDEAPPIPRLEPAPRPDPTPTETIAVPTPVTPQPPVAIAPPKNRAQRRAEAAEERKRIRRAIFGQVERNSAGDKLLDITDPKKPRASGRKSDLPQTKRTKGPGFVYLMYNPDNDRLKIGRAIDVRERLKSGRTFVPHLDLMAKFYTDDPEDAEHRVHAMFKTHWIEQEWFRWDARIVKAFRRMVSAQAKRKVIGVGFTALPRVKKPASAAAVALLQELGGLSPQQRNAIDTVTRLCEIRGIAA